ncbi:structural maintenance of chromosomes protein 1A-like [Chelonus insularis]|uniref:structural maintenance of chromosomes protein 1A-like n=1 Tax=Chelonus insularis TaxID=460826 RepID=UPI00158E86EF|nr:structural maintenance of chromosomes protein 1A-like [Chelonus insularis]
MATRLLKIEIKNFKSYAGIVRIDNFKSLNIVIGSNGCGKSNLMEAIAFSFGENKFRSRPAKIGNYFNSVCSNDEKECSVSCTFKYDMEDITFTRTLRKNRNIFTINDDIVNREEYLNKLNEIGINAKTRYFIIYQGESIESLLEKPKERAARFEEITGSVKYKDKYESLEKALEEQLHERKILNEQKRNLNKKMHNQKLDKSKEITRLELQSEFERMTEKVNLLQLYITEQNMKNYKKEFEILEEKKADRKKEREKTKGDIEKKNQMIAENERIIINLKSLIEAKENELATVRKKMHDSSIKIKKIEQSIHKVKQDICKAEQVDKLRTERIKQLEDEYQEIEELNNQTKQHLKKLEKKNITKMEEEYQTIYYKILRKGSDSSRRLRKIKKLQKKLHDNINNRKMEIMKRQMEIEQISSFLENYDKYSDQYTNLKNEFIKLKEERVEREKLMNSYREKENELMNIEEQLQLFKSHKADVEKYKNKISIMESLKNKIKEGVYGYLSDLCRPIHNRYEIALGIILKRHSSTIVIDTEETAYLCHTAVHPLPGRIKFLTLELLKNQYMRESSQDSNEYGEIQNVKLAIDIVKYPEEIRPAVQFAFKKTLVCETPNDAFQIAYNLKSGQRNDCISLNGIYYKNNGIIFKNKSTMKRNIPDISSLKDARKKLLVEMDNINEELINLDQMKKLSKIQSKVIEKKMSFIKDVMAEHEEQKNKKGQLESELSNLMEEEKKDQQQLKNLDEEAQEFKDQTNIHENSIFKKFYDKYNITNISKFQDLIKKFKKLQLDQEEYVNHLERIKDELEREKKDDTKSDLQRYQLKNDDLKIQLQEETDKYETLKKEENEKIKMLEPLQKELEKIDYDNTKLKKDVQKLEKCLSELIHGFFYLEFESHKRCADSYKRCYKEFNHLLNEARSKNLSFIKGSGDLIHSSFDSDENKNSVMDDRISDEFPTLHLGPELSIQLDYSLITNEIINNNIDSLKLMCEEYKSQLKIIDGKICELYLNNQWSQELEEIMEKVRGLNQQIDKLNKNLANIRINFDEIKQKRREKFMNGFEIISKWVKELYKQLCGDEDAHAFLEATNLEEPYLGDIQYICLPRRNKFYGHCKLSGGEKMIAMISLILAILKVDSSFLLLFDEVDASLDVVHSENIVQYFKTLNESHQIIYATFNENSMVHADILVGILAVKSHGSKSSKILTLDPDNY